MKEGYRHKLMKEQHGDKGIIGEVQIYKVVKRARRREGEEGGEECGEERCAYNGLSAAEAEEKALVYDIEFTLTDVVGEE